MRMNVLITVKTYPTISVKYDELVCTAGFREDGSWIMRSANRRISSVRVRIEHVIGDIKRYRIIHDIIRFSCSEFRDMVMETCCGLHNFRIWLKRKKQSENQNKS